MSRPAPGGHPHPTVPIERPLPGVRLLLRRSWWILLGGLVGLAAGGALTFVQEPAYESTAYLTVTSVGDSDPTSTARAAQALARLGAAPSVVGPSLEEAGLPDAAANPRLFVKVQAAPDASIISVTASASTAEEAQDIATTVGTTLVDLRAYATYRTRFVARPELPVSPTVPRWVPPAGGAGTGTAVGLVLAATVAAGRRTEPGTAGTRRAATED